MNSSLEHLHRATTDGKSYSTVELNHTDRYQVTVGRIGGATYPLWYSWHSQAWMQPSVPARPLFSLYISDLLLSLKKTQSQLNSGKHDRIRLFCVLAPLPQASGDMVYSAEW